MCMSHAFLRMVAQINRHGIKRGIMQTAVIFVLPFYHSYILIILLGISMAIVFV